MMSTATPTPPTTFINYEFAGNSYSTPTSIGSPQLSSPDTLAMRDCCTPLLTPFTSAHLAAAPTRGTELPENPHYFDSVDIRTFSHRQGESIAQDRTPELDRCPFSPINSLPGELLSLVFELGYFDGEEPDHHFRALVCRVSHRWREAAHHTPVLWSVFHLSQGSLDRLFHNLPVHLQRSADYPLDIHLNCFWDPCLTGEIIEHFLPHSERWRSLSITTPNADIFSFLRAVSAPKLKTLEISHFSSQRQLHLDPTLLGGHLPSLRHLSLHNISFNDTILPLKNLYSLDIRGFGVWPNHERLNELIGGSTSLRKLTFHVRPGSVLRDLDPQEGSPIILPALRTFDIITSEWLSPHITTLCRAFSCPSAELFAVKDSLGCGTIPAHNPVQRLRTGSTPWSFSLRVTACSLYLAWTCLNSSRRITTLDMDNIHWPHWSNMLTIISALPSLESMSMINVNPTSALLELGHPTQQLEICSLKSLKVGVIKRRRDSVDSDLAQFIKLLGAPNLRSLAVQNPTAEQWKHLASSFTEDTNRYLMLESLTVTNIDGLPETYPDLTLAFPNLQELALIDVTANPIIQHLFHRQQTSSTSFPGEPLPNLRVLTITGDPNTSRPLLHRIVSSRRQNSLALHLDDHFRNNHESWVWLNERAKVLLVPTVDR